MISRAKLKSSKLEGGEVGESEVRVREVRGER